MSGRSACCSGSRGVGISGWAMVGASSDTPFFSNIRLHQLRWWLFSNPCQSESAENTGIFAKRIENKLRDHVLTHSSIRSQQSKSYSPHQILSYPSFTCRNQRSFPSHLDPLQP